MRLLRLYAINSGVFDKTLIDFTNDGRPQDLICLSGVNGTGKTTIMDLISNLMGLLSDGLPATQFNLLQPNILTLTEFAQLDILVKNKVLSIVFGDEKYIQEDNEKEQIFWIDNEVKEVFAEIDDFLKLKENNLSDLDRLSTAEQPHFKEKYSKRNIDIQNEKLLSGLFSEISNKLDKHITKKDLNELPLLYYFATAERQIMDIRYKSIPKYQFKYKIAHKYNPGTEDLNGIFVYYDYAYQDKFEELKSWINTKVLVDKKLERIDRPEFKTLIKTRDGSEHGLELLSSGEKNLLIIAVQLYLKASQNTVFLIDEIDNNLHPEFQEKLMQIVIDIQKSFDCQVIASSHSRYVWNYFEDEQIIRLTELIK